MRLEVSDIRNYFWCPRFLWLKSNGIKIPNVGFAVGRQFHTLIHGITNMVFSVYKQELPGKIIETEITFSTEELTGRIDVLRLVEKEDERIFIIQDEKFKDPPSKKFGRVYPEDKIQIDAYAYLAEKNGYKPVSGLILYNDLIPREIKPEPGKIPNLIEKVKDILLSDVLPPIELSESDKFKNVEDVKEKCQICHYYPLCQILPEDGNVKMNEIKSLQFKRQTEILKEQLRKSLEILK